MNAAPPHPLTGRRVLAIALAFFGIVFAANGAFVWLALGSWTGVATENAYVEGLNYGDSLQRAAAQRAFGWRLEHAWTGGRLEVRLTDSAQAPVTGVELSASFRRPTHAGEDLDVLLRLDRPGVFRSETLALASGQWDLRILVERQDETVFRREERVWIK